MSILSDPLKCVDCGVELDVDMTGPADAMRPWYCAAGNGNPGYAADVCPVTTESHIPDRSEF